MGEVEYFVSYLYCPVTYSTTETKAQSRISAGSYSSTCPQLLLSTSSRRSLFLKFYYFKKDSGYTNVMNVPWGPRLAYVIVFC